MWVIVSLTSLAILFILALSVPLDIALHMDIYGRPRVRMKLAWLFGLVSKEVTTRKKQTETKRRIVEGRAGLRERWSRFQTIVEILRTKGLLTQLKGLLQDVVGRLEIRDVAGNFKVGLDDPADAGVLCALAGPATLFLNSSFPCHLEVQPSFDGEASFEGSLEGTVRVRPLKLVAPLARFAFSSATIRATNRLISTRWKRRK